MLGAAQGDGKEAMGLYSILPTGSLPMLQASIHLLPFDTDMVFLCLRPNCLSIKSAHGTFSMLIILWLKVRGRRI